MVLKKTESNTKHTHLTALFRDYPGQPPNQQRQSTEGTNLTQKTNQNTLYHKRKIKTKSGLAILHDIWSENGSSLLLQQQGMHRAYGPKLIFRVGDMPKFLVARLHLPPLPSVTYLPVLTAAKKVNYMTQI